MGPITLFDKSFLEMLNVDEAALFDALFSANICPIFYTEVLADLDKEPPGERSREKIVADVARKTPVMHSTPNMLHASICLSELNGHAVHMRRVPIRPGGVPVRHEGKVGIIYEKAPELKAFHRWQQGRFLDLERDFASTWRAQLKDAKHAEMARLAKHVLRIQASPRNLDEALAIAREVVCGTGQQFLTLKTAYALLALPQRHWSAVQDRWKQAGRPPLQAYAPYTAHCLMVDVFFHVAVDKKLISPDRPSNRIDIAYLYYLPFCMVFVSNDKLHRRAAPPFMSDRQAFISGEDLKRDLAALDAHYSALPAEQLDQGIFRLASYPPNDDAFLTTRLWKQLKLPVERKEPAINPDRIPSAELLAIVDELKRKSQGRPPGVFAPDEVGDPSHVVIERRIPLRMGKWKTMPPGVKPDTD
jgi:hypothetical protein